MMIIGLVGCGKSIDTEKAGKEEELSIEEQNVQSAKQTIEKVFENFKKLNFAEAGQNIDVAEIEAFIDSELGYMSGDQFMNEWFDTLNFEIISAENVDDTTVSIYGKLIARDMAELLLKHHEMFSSYMDQNLENFYSYSQEQLKEFIKTKSTETFRECVKSDDYTTITSSVTLNVVNTDGNWHVEIDDDFLNALLGDYIGGVEALGIGVSQ